MIRYFISAMRTLTAIPVPGKDCEPFENSLFAFPIVGAILGVILTGVARLLSGNIFPELSLPILPLAALLVLLQTLITRGFHLDGIADAADGFGGGFTKERALEIMKDSRVGAFGAIAIALDLLLKFSLFAALLEKELFDAIFITMIFSRTSQVFQCVIWDYARPTGTAAATVQNSTKRHLLVTILFSFALTALVGHRFIILLPIALLAAFLWGLYCKKRVGGITGDLLGATNEIVEIALMFGALLL